MTIEELNILNSANKQMNDARDNNKRLKYKIEEYKVSTFCIGSVEEMSNDGFGTNIMIHAIGSLEGDDAKKVYAKIIKEIDKRTEERIASIKEKYNIK